MSVWQLALVVAGGVLGGLAMLTIGLALTLRRSHRTLTAGAIRTRAVVSRLEFEDDDEDAAPTLLWLVVDDPEGVRVEAPVTPGRGSSAADVGDELEVYYRPGDPATAVPASDTAIWALPTMLLLGLLLLGFGVLLSAIGLVAAVA